MLLSKEEVEAHRTWAKNLREKHAKLFKNYQPRRSIQVKPGWNALVERVLVQLDSLSEAYGQPLGVSLIKQKMGRLDFYLDFPNGGETPQVLQNIALDVTKAATGAATYVCEICGEYGKRQQIHGYRTVLCNTHNEAQREFVKKRDARE